MEQERPQARGRGLVRKLWPWVVGIAILAFVVSRIPFATFRDAITRGPHLQLAIAEVAIFGIALCTDAASTWVALGTVGIRRPFTHVLAVRGATYVLFVINYAVGQGGFGFYLHRSGAPALKAVGATLYLMGTNLAVLLVLAAIAASVAPADIDPTLWWTLIGSCAAFALYLVIIAISPGPLARRQVLAPLFEAGLRGHAIALAGRIPHVAVLVIGTWVAIRVWGIPVPFVVGLAVMPVVVIISVLPIAPAGIGTTQAALVYFFARYAGDTLDAGAAEVFAFGVAHLVYSLGAMMLFGVSCIPLAKRTGVLAPKQSAPSSGT